MAKTKDGLPPEAPPRFEFRVLPDPASVAKAAAGEFARACTDAAAARGVFRVALSGGSTPRSTHQRLVAPPHRARVPWNRVRFFWSDERCVPPDNDRSNYHMAKETLLGPLGIAPEHVFRMRGEDDPRAAAEQYEEVLRSQFPDRPVPRFDLVLLGMGPDGHTASLFPATRALRVRSRPVAANYVASLTEWRLTLTYPVFNAARRVIFLVTGAGKRAAAERILKRRRGWRALPAAGVRPDRGSLLWLLDEEAGGRL